MNKLENLMKNSIKKNYFDPSWTILHQIERIIF